MKRVAVFASERRSNAIRKEDLIHDSIDAALHRMPDVACVRRGVSGDTAPVSLPGLKEVRPQEAIVALGQVAHTFLADYRKQTLVAAAEDERFLEDVEIERLVWSCVNTLKMVALGRRAWRSIQMLPVADRRFYDLPPLCMPGCETARRDDEDVCGDILVINHEKDGARAVQLAEALSLEGYLVQRTGLGIDVGGAALDDGGWSSSAAIHVHVGSHDIAADQLRLVDTWRSRRHAIAYVPRRVAQDPPPGTLRVDAEVNGFVCDSVDKVFAACADLRADGVLRKKMLRAGAVAVNPLTSAWATIAADLIA